MQEPIVKFWIVWCETQGGPIYKHSTKADAQREAARLARNSPGRIFVVLSAVDAIVASVCPPQSIKLVKSKSEAVGAAVLDSEIPF